jgi:hypothetical protein
MIHTGLEMNSNLKENKQEISRNKRTLAIIYVPKEIIETYKSLNWQTCCV